MSVINATPLLAAAGGDYQISRSVRLRSSASANFTRTPASSGNRKTWTWSGWVKRGLINTSSQTLFSAGSFTSGNLTTSISFKTYTPSGLNESIVLYSGVYAGSLEFQFGFANVFRDPSAWYHLVVAFDTTQATSSNRIKVYVNGSQITSSPIGFAGRPTTVSQNYDTAVNNTAIHYIGGMSTQYDGTEFTDGFLTEVNFIDGQALTPSSFGETDTITGVWKPKKYAGTYGTNGFYLNFSDNSSNTATTIGKDYSGNGNNWTPNNISVTAGVTYDSMIDVPTLYADGGNGRGNYCALNSAIRPYPVADNISNANLTFTSSSASVSGSVWGTIPMSSDKWYAECTVTTAGTGTGVDYIGVSSNMDFAGRGTYASALRDYGYTYRSNGNACNNSSTGSAYGASFTSGDVIGIAFDADAGTITFYKNNTSQGTAFTGMTSSGGFLFGSTGFNGSVHNWNFGQRPFSYTPPTGFKALNTQNLPAPTILKGNQYFDVLTYTGDGTTPRSITGLQFQPDLVWNKARSNTYSNALFDAVRGAGSGKDLISDSTAAEGANSPTFGWISSFDAAGYTVTKGSNAVNTLNNSGSSFVSWQWKANGSAVTNTSGSITSQVSAGTSQGFSVVTYTGTGANATVGHGLGVAPKMIIVKNRSSGVVDWAVYHANLTSAAYNLWLNDTSAQASRTYIWNSTAPTSSVFSVGTGSQVNGSGNSIVAYCFSEVAGFSKFGSYTGNGSADGPFIFTGFRPAFIMIKGSSFVSNWFIQDDARNGYNVNTGVALRPNLSNAEDGTTFYDIDILSNGFKLRTSTGDSNSSGATFIFMAFAESPFKNSLAR